MPKRTTELKIESSTIGVTTFQGPHEDVLRKAERYVTTAGITILFGFVAAVLLLRTSSTDTGQRGAGQGAIAASAWLTILWVAGAAILAAIQGRRTGLWFRAIFAANAILLVLLLSEWWFA